VARPFWSGQIRISLVSFGVKLFPATEAKSEIRFHQIDRKTGERVRHHKVSEGDDAPVEKEDIVKGYEYRKGRYVQIEPGEIEHLRIPSRHTLDAEQFVDVDTLDPALFEKPYFVVPENNAQAEAFAVVREALRESKKAALGKIAFGGREHLIAANHSRQQVHKIRAALDADGIILAIDDRYFHDQGAYVRTHAARVIHMTAGILPGPYRVPAYRAVGHFRLTNKTPAATYRAPGRYETTFVRERLIDAIATKLGIEPNEVRRRNAIAADEMPYHRPLEALGEEIEHDSGDYVGLLDKLMTLVGELVLARNQVLQFTATHPGSALLGTSQRLNLITTELQEHVMKTRLQPIGNVAAPHVVDTDDRCPLRLHAGNQALLHRGVILQSAMAVDVIFADIDQDADRRGDDRRGELHAGPDPRAFGDGQFGRPVAAKAHAMHEDAGLVDFASRLEIIDHAREHALGRV